jgi:endonuclease YncB( thermonuclease family)
MRPVTPAQIRRRSPGPDWLLTVVFLLILGALALWLRAPEPPVGGHVLVVDGDTLRMSETRIRLIGIDAPELEQSCTDARGGSWACGTAARDQMRALVSGQEVTCTPDGADRYGRMLAHCSAGGHDLGQMMVEAGLAVADLEYAPSEVSARSGHKGIWAGSFELPSQWRADHGESAESPIAGWLRAWFR